MKANVTKSKNMWPPLCFLMKLFSRVILKRVWSSSSPSAVRNHMSGQTETLIENSSTKLGGGQIFIYFRKILLKVWLKPVFLLNYTHRPCIHIQSLSRAILVKISKWSNSMLFIDDISSCLTSTRAKHGSFNTYLDSRWWWRCQILTPRKRDSWCFDWLTQCKKMGVHKIHLYVYLYIWMVYVWEIV